ncbi:uncharacterized protein LOC133313812 [Gastrolobium bilobum]|uniref:uncharacterized protein LOC133313812 n=1 Tax=Gastrolobium bilobum TaxID=150636 RepID=UPI002AB1CE58|nr:uncharacterized protein LOC133313812 [Gastrolobium bilobum]
MGCLVSIPNDSGGNRRRPRSIGEVSVYVPGLRIPKPVDFAQSLGEFLSKSIVERLSALRTRIVVMAGQEGPTITRTKRNSATRHGGSTLADLLQALEDYLPVLLGLVKDGSNLKYKVQFVWVNQEDDKEETTMSNAWYEVLSVLHLMAMLLLSQANLLLLPRSSTDGYQAKVSEESRRASVDIFLKAAGYLDCAVRHVLPQLPAELRRNLPVDLAEGVLRALCLQALGQITNHRLNGKNFLQWFQSVKLVILAKGKMGYLEGRIKKPTENSPDYDDWEINNSLVIAWLTNSMEPQIGQTYLFFDTAKEIWDAVQQNYSDLDLSSF